jgi:hypothetical protein
VSLLLLFPVASGSASSGDQNATLGGPTGSATGSLSLNAAGAVTLGGVSASATGTMPGAPVITTTSLPSGLVGVAYSQTVQASGGSTPRTFAVTSGALPTGLSLNASTGEISGTPTVEAAFSFTITVTDAVSATDDQAFSVSIASASARSDLRVQQITRTGLAPTMETANAFGHALPNAGAEFIMVKTTSNPCVVTIPARQSGVSSRTVSIGAGVTKLIGPFPPHVYNQANETVSIDFDDVTGVTLGAFRAA